ncbi:hypothetical protein BDFB_009218 [Asbolus verrucosus]|uniref:Uncharacterized protein n=1 Tax=Asbolus verrucosus TaxID=1661398 RepID=A0A482VTC0_ASBVE|nr:hypothetical protein BDFB_009218 [Asbolus verrucosus]
MQERAGNTSPPRWWKQTEQYLCELMRTENNLFEQNEKCKKHIEASALASFYHACLHNVTLMICAAMRMRDGYLQVVISSGICSFTYTLLHYIDS